jgi:hypothetical protein
MKLTILLWAAVLAAQTRDIPIQGANLLRVDRNARVVVGESRVEVQRGAVVYRIVDSGAPPVEIVTPAVTVHPYFMGDYRIEVKKSGEATITPLGGEVKVTAPQGAEWVPVGRKMIARGPAANPSFRVVSALSGWRWIAEGIRTAMKNSGGGGVSVDADVSTASDDSSSRSRPTGPPPASAPSSVGRGAASGDTRSGSPPSRGK